MDTYQTFSIIFISIATALVLSPLAIWLSDKIGLVDSPDDAPHKVHANPVPASGGLVLVGAVMIIAAITGILSDKTIQAIFYASLIVFGFGIWDDFKGLPPAGKLFGQLLAAIVLISLGVQVLLFQYQWLNILVTIFWMVGVSNAFNLVDSMDGLADGLGTLAAAFFMLVTIESQQQNLTIFSTIILGAGVGIYYYNAPPARLFLGDSGAQAFGFLLGAMAISYNPVGYSPFSSWFIPIFLLGVPIFDTSLVVYTRLRLKRPVYRASLDHTYHRLVEFGMDPTRAVLAMHMAALILGSLAIIALNLPPVLSNVIFGLVLALGSALVLILGSDYRRSAG